MRIGMAWIGLLFPLGVWAEEPELEPDSDVGSEEESAEDPPQERPVPVALPPRVPPKVPQVEPEPARRKSVLVTGEFRGVGLAARLDTLDSRVPDQNPSLSVDFPLVLLGLEAGLGGSFEARVGIRADGAATVADWNGQGLWDAQLRGLVGTGAHLAVGLLPAAFGFGESDTEWAGDFGGVDQWLPLAWVSGFTPTRVTGVSFEQTLSSWGVLHLQAAQNPDILGGGSGTVSMRFRGEPTSRLRLESYIAGRFTVERDRGVGEGSPQFATGLRADSDRIRILGELLLSAEENGPMAWGVTGAVQLPWPVEGVDSTELLMRLRDINPTAVTEEDRIWQIASGLSWQVTVPELSLLSVALLWEMDLPEDVDAAIEHEASLGARVRF